MTYTIGDEEKYYSVASTPLSSGLKKENDLKYPP